MLPKRLEQEVYYKDIVCKQSPDWYTSVKLKGYYEDALMPTMLYNVEP